MQSISKKKATTHFVASGTHSVQDFMTYLILIILSMLCLLGIPKVAFCDETNGHRTPKEWTIMVYMCADNDLEEMAIYDLLEMEQGIHDDVNILVLLDRAQGFSSLYGNHHDTRLYEIRKSSQPYDFSKIILGKNALPNRISSKLLRNLGELNLSDPANIVELVKEATAHYPARRFALIPWNHGGGWKSMLHDLNNGTPQRRDNHMQIKDFAKSLESALPYLPNKRFDAIIFEMCLMGQADVLHELSPYTDYVFASPPVMPAVGIDYATALAYFDKNISTENLVKNIVTNSKEYLEKNHILECAYSSYNLSHMSKLTEALYDLNRYLMTLLPKHYVELTQTLAFATHLNSIESDITYGKPSYWSVSLPDFLRQLPLHLPDMQREYVERAMEALNNVIMTSEATSNAKDLMGMAVYLPLRREYMADNYPTTDFANKSGFYPLLEQLYRAQELKNNNKPRIENIKVGTARLKPSRKGLSATDFEVIPDSRLMPLNKSVIAFDVTGEDILWTYIYQIENKNNRHYINYSQLLREYNYKQHDNGTYGYLKRNTPHYNNGTTHLIREITGQKYLITDGSNCYDISIQNTSTANSLNDNVSIGYGMYTDATLGGQELYVKLKFSNLNRMLMGAEVVQGQGNNQSGSQITLKPGGTLRPALSYLEKNEVKTEFGKPIKIGRILALTLGMLEPMSKIRTLIRVQTADGKNAMSLSALYTIYYDDKLQAYLENTRNNAEQNLLGTYTLIQHATDKDGTHLLPNFRNLSLECEGQKCWWSMQDANGEKIDNGSFVFLNVGTPQLLLYKKAEHSEIDMRVENVQNFYSFLYASGSTREWYLISMGEGTRYTLSPLSSQNIARLKGSWRSDTELWNFTDDEVSLIRVQEKLKAKSKFRLVNNLILAKDMPFSEYCFYIDSTGHNMTIISRDGHASFLKRVNGQN